MSVELDRHDRLRLRIEVLIDLLKASDSDGWVISLLENILKADDNW